MDDTTPPLPRTDLPDTADDMFCYAIYTAWHVVNRAYKPHLSRLGLTYPQYITLTLLWEKDERNVGELGRLLSMESNTLTPLLKRMESMGLVNRTRRKTDERQVAITLTAKGKALQDEAPNITSCMIRDTGLDPEQLGQLVEILSQLKRGFQPG